MENQTNSINLLLSMHCKLLYNQSGMSAMDYAIHYKFPEAALAMVTHEERGQEIMALRSSRHPCVTLALIASMSKVFEAVQNKAITKANCKKDSKSFYIKYNFACLQCPQLYADMDCKTGEALNISKPIPLPALNAMVSHGRVELLAHPLSQKYLQMKWNSYGKYFHVANVLFYSIFLAFITCFCAQLMKRNEMRPYLNLSEMENRTNSTQAELPYLPMMSVSSLAIIIYIALNSVREFIQMYQQKCLYFLDPINLVSWLLYSSALITVLHIYSDENDELQFSCASLTVFLSWLNLLLLLQRFDQVGIYVVMFLEILQTLIKVLMVFSILIIAFGLAFYILLSRGNHHAFQSIPISLVRTFSMMLGEIDFLGTYVKLTDGYLPYPLPTFFILVLFMVLMPILLMNLLIGLAVGDIESVRRNAQLKRLAMQVVLHTELERKLPNRIMEKIDKTEIIEYPNDTKSVGFFDSLLRKWFGNPFSDDASDIAMDTGEDYIVSELGKTKKKLKEISTALETQQQFLRLIVQVNRHSAKKMLAESMTFSKDKVAKKLVCLPFDPRITRGLESILRKANLQKMEIKTDAEEMDEGVSSAELNPHVNCSNKWNSPKIKKQLRTLMSFNKGI